MRRAVFDNFATKTCPIGTTNESSSEQERSGIFVYEQAGRLAGIEVYGLTGEAAKTLPTISDLEPFGDRVRSR